jgi:hypothetical protein
VRARSENEPDKTRALLVTVTRPGVELEVSTSSLNVLQNGAAVFNVFVTRTGGYRGIPELRFEPLPYGVSAAVTNMETLLNGQLRTTITLTATSLASVIATSMRVTASTSYDSQSVVIPLEVRASGSPRVVLIAPTQWASILPGEAVAFPLRVARGGVEGGNVSLALSSQSELESELTPNPVDGDSAALRVHTTSQTAPGRYFFTVLGTIPGAVSSSIGFEVLVKHFPGFTIGLDGGVAVNLLPGATAVRNLRLSRVGGFTDAVRITAAGGGSGVQLELPEFAASMQNAALPLRVVVDASVAPGTYEFVLTGRSDSGSTHAFTLYVNVLSP